MAERVVEHLSLQRGRYGLFSIYNVSYPFAATKWTNNAPSTDSVTHNPRIVVCFFHIESHFIPDDVTSDWTRNSLNSLQNYEKEVRRNARLALLQCHEESSRLEQLIGLLYQSIFSVIISTTPFKPHRNSFTDFRSRLVSYPLSNPVPLKLCGF